MALGTFIDGAYAGTYNAVAIGMTEDGYDLIQALAEEVISESDVYGGALLDYIYRGGAVQVRADSKEYAAGSTNPFWPWGSLGQMRTPSTPIGRLASNVAVALVLTATASTPAATAPATLTGSKSILAPGQQGTLKFTSKLRRVPIFLQLLPTDSSGTTTWFTTT